MYVPTSVVKVSFKSDTETYTEKTINLIQVVI